MNVQNGNDLSLTSLSTEYKRTSDTMTEQSQAKQPGSISIEQVNTAPQSAQSTGSTSATTIENQPLTSQQLDKVAQQLQDFVGDLNRNIEFTVDKDSGRDVIKVVDKASGDLLKQYPSEEVLTLVSKLSDMVGGFIDAKV
jgi:flagellar protein FlaG